MSFAEGSCKDSGLKSVSCFAQSDYKSRQLWPGRRVDMTSQLAASLLQYCWQMSSLRSITRHLCLLCLTRGVLFFGADHFIPLERPVWAFRSECCLHPFVVRHHALHSCSNLPCTAWDSASYAELPMMWLELLCVPVFGCFGSSENALSGWFELFVQLRDTSALWPISAHRFKFTTSADAVTSDFCNKQFLNRWHLASFIYRQYQFICVSENSLLRIPAVALLTDFAAPSHHHSTSTWLAFSLRQKAAFPSNSVYVNVCKIQSWRSHVLAMLLPSYA